MSDMIMVKKARVSFPHLFKKPMINGSEGKRGANLMLDPKTNAVTIKAIENKIQELTKERFKGKKIPSDKLCLRNGEDKGRSEYEGYEILSANSKDRPLVLGKQLEVIKDEEDCEIYSGCYVNAKVRLWAQDNQYGKRINCELVAIQFAAHGEALDGVRVSVDEAVDGFDDMDDDDDDYLNAG